jgi:hypothetical protein
VGQLAARNSCRQPWTTAFDLQSIFARIFGPSIQRNATIQLLLINPLAGIDRLFHGEANLRGWGQQAFADPTLPFARGFDAANQQYLYTVNENFGRNNAARTGFRTPFQVGLNVRYQLGPDRRRQMLEGMARGGGTGATAAGGGAAGPGSGGGFNVKDMVSRIAPTPIAPIIARRDSFGLTGRQVVSLDSLQVKFDALVGEIASSLEKDVNQLAKDGGDSTSLLPKMQPRFQSARNIFLAIIDEAKKVLTPAQWVQLPTWIQNPSLVLGR